MNYIIKIGHVDVMHGVFCQTGIEKTTEHIHMQYAPSIPHLLWPNAFFQHCVGPKFTCARPRPRVPPVVRMGVLIVTGDVSSA